MRRWGVPVAVGLLLLGLLALAVWRRPPDSPPDLRGQIQEVGESRILVRAPAPPGAANPRLVWVRVTKKTGIGVVGATATPPPTFASLTVGTMVYVWFDGPVRESYPEQADGRWILITGIE